MAKGNTKKPHYQFSQKTVSNDRAYGFFSCHGSYIKATLKLCVDSFYSQEKRK